MRNLLMYDFQVPKCIEYWSFGESVARYGNWIIGSIENAEISVFFVDQKVFKKTTFGHSYWFEISIMKNMWIFTLKIWTLKTG